MCFTVECAAPAGASARGGAMGPTSVGVERGGPSELGARVLAAGLCAGCGACLGHCPYLKTLGERVAFIHPCPRTEGRCYEVCPRTGLNPDALDRQVFGAPRRDGLLGGYEALYWARALDPEVGARGQRSEEHTS